MSSRDDAFLSDEDSEADYVPEEGSGDIGFRKQPAIALPVAQAAKMVEGLVQDAVNLLMSNQQEFERHTALAKHYEGEVFILREFLDARGYGPDDGGMEVPVEELLSDDKPKRVTSTRRLINPHPLKPGRPV